MARTIGVVGGGLMGCLAALSFSRRGDRVVLFERLDRLMASASRGNEGKVHLGFTYGLDATGRTQRLMHRYGSGFRPALEQLLDRDLSGLFLHERQHYAVHRNSALPEAEVDAHMAMIGALPRRGAAAARTAKGEPVVRKLGRDEIAERFSDAIVAAYDVAELNLDCPALVRMIRDAVESAPGIEVRTGTRVASIGEADRPEVADASGTVLGAFDLVVNAAWDGMPALERRSGVALTGLCLRGKAGFIASVPQGLPDRPVTIVYGSFGDIVPLAGGLAYLSWYPSCLMGFSLDVDQGVDWYDGVAAGFDFQAAYEQACAAFGALMPAMRFGDEPVECRAGPILASARSDISDPASGLHRRTNFGISRRGRIYAINTGKLTCAPVLAEELGRLAG